MYSRNQAFYSLSFIWEIKTKLAFPLFQAFKTGIWLLGNDNGFQICANHIIFCETDRTQLNMSNLIVMRSRQSIGFLWGSRLSKIEPSDVICIPDSVMRTAEMISMRLIIYSSQGPICVSFSLTVYSVNWLKFSADRVFYSVP